MLATLDKNGAQLDDESLGSFLCEEAIVNSRPLDLWDIWTVQSTS